MVTNTGRFQLNGRTAAQWTAANTVLLSRELGVESDTGKLKVGNGATAWNMLPYLGDNVTAGVSSINGTKTGAVTLAKADVGLGSVDNTADTAKPVSTAQATALAAKADFPTGGVNGQVLSKNGTTTAWITPPFTPSAPTPSGGDDTAALTAWLTSTAIAGKVATLQPATYRITGLTLPAGTTLLGYGTTLTFLTPPAGVLTALTLNTRCRVYGVEIDGTAAAGSGLYGITTFQNVTDLVVEDCRIHDIKGTGISFDRATRFRTSGNVIGACTGNGIGATFSTNGIINGNALTANSGIEVWGGDANTATPTIGSDTITVTGNTVTGNGVIFFSCVRTFTVTGNTVRNAPDVGIDFEGCADGTAAGNTVVDAVNGCYSLFFASKNITFTGNRAVNTLTTGRGAALGIYSAGFRSTGIVITGNRFTAEVAGIITDQSCLGDSVISGNQVTVTGGGIPLLVLDGFDVTVTGNRFATAGSRGISLEGTYDSTVAANRIIHTGGSDPSGAGADGGVWIYNRSSAFPGNHNVIRGNKIAGFTTGIADRGNANLIEDNSVDTVWHNQSGGGYTTFISGNRTLGDPTVTAAVTAVP